MTEKGKEESPQTNKTPKQNRTEQQQKKNTGAWQEEAATLPCVCLQNLLPGCNVLCLKKIKSDKGHYMPDLSFVD